MAVFFQNIYKHLLSERHVKAAIEKQGKVFDPEIMKVELHEAALFIYFELVLFSCSLILYRFQEL